MGRLSLPPPKSGAVLGGRPRGRRGGEPVAAARGERHSGPVARRREREHDQASRRPGLGARPGRSGDREPVHGAGRLSDPDRLPSGRAGLAPRLALRYSGTLGNGPIGIGWTFDMPIGPPDRAPRRPRLRCQRRAGAVRHRRRRPSRARSRSHQSAAILGRGQGVAIKVVQRNGRFEITDASGVRYFLGNSSASREEQDGRARPG